MDNDIVNVPVKDLGGALALLENLMESIGKGNPGYDDFAMAAVKIRWMLKDVPEGDDE